MTICSQRFSNEHSASPSAGSYGRWLVPGAIVLLVGCNTVKVELDRMPGAEFPPDKVSPAGGSGDSVTLGSLFASATEGRGIEVEEDDTDVPEMFPADYCIRNSDIQALVVAFRDDPTAPTVSSCFGGFTCTEHHVYGAMFNYRLGGSSGVCQDAAGFMMDPDNRGLFIMFKPVQGLSDEEFLRATAHEFGHTFNLHHEDSDLGTLMRDFLADGGFVLSARSQSHLDTHPEDKVWPNAGSFDDFTNAHAQGHGTSLTAVGDAEASSPLVLDLAPVPASPVLGEPVYLVATLENAGSTPAAAPNGLEPEEGATEVVISGPDGARRAFLPLIAVDRLAPEAELKPGARRIAEFPVFYGGHGWTFDRPGKYVLNATYRGPGGVPTVAAKPVALQVSEGDPAAPLLLDNGEAGRQAGRFLTWLGGDHLDQGIAALEHVVDQHPESVLAAYARVALGVNLGREAVDSRGRGIRDADCGEALRLLDGADDSELPPMLRMRKALAQASCHVRLEDDQAARGLVSRAEAQAGGRPDLRRELKALADLYGLPR
jgi:hypothetical protein